MAVLYVHEVLVNRLGGLSLPRKSVVRLTDRPDMTLDVYRRRKTTIQQQQQLECSKPMPLGNAAKDKFSDRQIIKGEWTFLTLISPLVSQPVTWRDLALLHAHGANCGTTLLNYKVFDDNLIRYL